MSSDQIKLEIDGKEFAARPGQMVIDVADKNDIYIPRFCYHEKLSIAANCRMCLVEVEKAPKPLPACATPVADGMKVFTRSPKAISAQKATMEFLLINHPLDCPICDQGGECELQDLAMGFGRDVSRYTERKRVVKDENLGSLISTDMTRCIHCTRCVRFGTEVAGIQELGATGRGENMRIGTYIERSVDHEMSGNVIDLCPVGALNSKPFRMRARGWEMAQRETISAHDCAGSNTFSHILRGELMRVVPRANEAINETWISDRDRFGYTGIYSEERLQKPMIKKNGVWQEVDWEVALEASVKILKTISEEESGDQIGVLASPSATLEELYLLRKVADEFATRNIDHRINQHDFSDDDDFPAWPWIGARISDLEHIDAGLLIGSNIRKEVPIIGHRIRKAALRGADVMFINPGRFEHLFPVSEYINADVAGMLNQIAALLKAVAVHAGKQVPKHLQKITGEATPDEAMKNMAAKLVNGKKTIVLLGLLAEAHPASADIRILAAAIADIANAAIGYLSSGANSAGAWLTGAVPHRDIGGKPSAEKGLNAKDMLAKKRRAYFLLGVEPHIDCWDAAVASEAMKNADVIALSPFVSESIKEYADVLLPIGTWGETGGTFINAEGERQSFQGAANPVGEARPAWKVLRVFGNLLGIDGFDYMSVEEVANEAVDAIGEIKPNSSLRGEREVKPLPVESGFMRCGDTALYGADMLVRRAVPLQNSADAKLASTARLSPADAKKLGVSSSDKVVIKQNGSSVTLPVSIDEGIVAGSVWLSSGVVATAGLGPKFGSITVEKA